MADSHTAPVQARFGGSGSSDVSARLQQVLALLFPSNFAAKAVLFAVIVALLPLLPTSQVPRIWELPHILLLGLVISYGVFGQRNTDAEVVAAKIVDEDDSIESYVTQIMQGPLVFAGNDVVNGDGNGAKDGVHAWSSQYYPDDPLVVVADAGSNIGHGDASEKPLLLPVRKLKSAAEESAAGNVSDGGTEEDEEEAEELFATKAGYVGVREHAMRSPSSVLDANLTLSPSSPPLFSNPPPPPPPSLNGGERALRNTKARSFNDYGVRNVSMSERVGSHSSGGNRFRSNSATQATRRRTFAGYDPVTPFDDQAASADDEKDEMVAAASDSSFSSDMVTDGEDDNDQEAEANYEQEEEEEEEDISGDEELLGLATRPGPEEDEVDRKADEFIAKFREQIRMQRGDPGRR